MSIAQIPTKEAHSSKSNKARPRPQFIEEVISSVTAVIAPVWPLRDYVAVNPYAGLSHRPFFEARAFMKAFSDCESLMSIEHYANEFYKGHFNVEDIASAIAELEMAGLAQSLTAAQIAENLRAIGPSPATCEHSPSRNQDRPMRTLAEHSTIQGGVDWTEAIVEEISKHCAAHFDQGQALWSSPYKHLSLYEAWLKTAVHDYNIEILGLRGFRKLVAALPNRPEDAIAHLLISLQVPVRLWSTFLLCQAFSIPGWCAWTKYQTNWIDAQGFERNDLTGLLAIRLAYDAAVADAKSLRLNWTALAERELHADKSAWSTPDDDSLLRYVLLRASEISFRSGLLGSLEHSIEDRNDKSAARKLAQMVFCIDVRSERMRRQLEMHTGDIETLGFAGFFGMGFEYVAAGQSSGKSQLPVLLKPQFRVYEGAAETETAQERQLVRERLQRQTWTSLWKSFQGSAVGCFSFVETVGLGYGLQLLARALGVNTRLWKAKLRQATQSQAASLHPTFRSLTEQGITAARQADMAEGMLRNLGLVSNFASLVVFCGHGCQTENNPLSAGLDCGACGGHSGEPNARFTAMLLNQVSTRTALAERGIHIPSDTHFLAALHNTTTDEISFFDCDQVPLEHQIAVEKLVSHCAVATQQTQIERLPSLENGSVKELLQRAFDWSEVRPEWGLAGNAAFIVAPRSFTKDANLDARCFLHSYDYRLDQEGKVLETIMTAPMIVANWINLQYYASSVDNHHFGSGNKTLHNVVGRFGILSGSGGDLQTGLPWQSVHNGDSFQHLPLRLQVVIAAPREMIDRVILKHEVVSNLIDGSWLHLIAIDAGQAFRCVSHGQWEALAAR